MFSHTLFDLLLNSGGELERRSSRVDIVLKTASLSCLLLFGYLIVSHGWDNHYLLVMLACLFWAGLLFLPVGHRVNATLLVVSFSAALFLVNLILAIKVEVDQVYPRSHWRMTQAGAAHIPRIAVTAKQQGHEFDTRTRVDVLLDLRAKGVDAWPSLTSTLLYRDYPRSRNVPLVELSGVPTLPLGGISNKTVVYCNESGSYILLENDEYGFSNPRGLWKMPRVDIAAVGDSFTHGACVSQDESFTAVLRRRYPASLNLGNDSNGPLAELATLREYLPSLRPRIVLWVYSETNDLDDLSREIQSPLSKYLNPGYSQGLPQKQAEIDQALMKITNDILAVGNSGSLLGSLVEGMTDRTNYVREFEQIMKLSHVWHLVTNPRQFHVAEPDLSQDANSAARNIELLQKVLTMGRDEVRRWGGELMFVYLPQWERYSGIGTASPHRQAVLDLVAMLEIPIIDIHQVFSRQSDPLALFPFRQPAHYNSHGYHLVGGEIERQLVDRLIPRNLS